jgi:hypothetical protein
VRGFLWSKEGFGLLFFLVPDSVPRGLFGLVTDSVSSGDYFTASGNCTLVGDDPPCGTVTLFEVVTLINQWSGGHASLSDVIKLINAWASPGSATTTTSSTSTTTTARTSTTSTTTTVTSGIIVVSPNGGETWQRGTIHTVSWTYAGSGLGSYVKLALLKAGTEVGTINASSSIGSGGSGSYVWNISSSSPNVGSDFTISVQSTTQPSINDTSDAYFTLTAATTTTTTTTSGTSTTSTTTTTPFDVPTIGGVQIFPADHIYNTRVDNLSVDPNSDMYINRLRLEGATILTHYIRDGVPYNIVNSSTPHQYVTGFRANGYYSDNVSYPITDNPNIEPSGGDKHLCIVDVDERKLYELGVVSQKPNGSWTAASGSVWDLTGYMFRLGKNNNETPMWGQNEAGVPELPGLVRYEEVSAGHINHLLDMAVPLFQDTWVWPARSTVGGEGDANPTRPPAGQRFRLKSSYDISHFPPQAKVILQALKTYGGMGATNGGICTDGSIRNDSDPSGSCPYPENVTGPFSVIGSPDARWNSTDLNTLYTVPITAFEAVDTTPLIIDPNSAKARSTPPIPITRITVTSPNGRETWQRGTTHTITWTYAGGSPDSYVTIKLLKAGNVTGTIAVSAPIGSGGSGSYVWDISSASSKVGSDFQVEVESVNQPDLSDTSNQNFTLTLAA